VGKEREARRTVSAVGIIGGLLTISICLLAGCGVSTRDAGAAGPGAATGTPPIILTGSAAVSIVNFAFNPTTLTVSAGTTVVWTNTAPLTPHTVTSDPGAPVAFDGPVDAGSTFSFTFTVIGTYHYHCTIHPGMHGTIIITAPPTPTSTPAPATPTASPGPPPGK
jgi:plastocyanin